LPGAGRIRQPRAPTMLAGWARAALCNLSRMVRGKYLSSSKVTIVAFGCSRLTGKSLSKLRLSSVTQRMLKPRRVCECRLEGINFSGNSASDRTNKSACGWTDCRSRVSIDTHALLILPGWLVKLTTRGITGLFLAIERWGSQSQATMRVSRIQFVREKKAFTNERITEEYSRASPREQFSTCSSGRANPSQLWSSLPPAR